jgi:hypothetical protein
MSEQERNRCSIMVDANAAKCGMVKRMCLECQQHTSIER